MATYAINMKKRLRATFITCSILCFNLSVQAQVSIDPTAIERLIQLKNLVDKAKTQIAQLKSVTKQGAATKANTTGILETGSKIEDLLRSPDEYLKLAYHSMMFNDATAILKLNAALKGNFASNLNANFKITDLTPYLDGKNYSDKSGSAFYDLVTKGTTIDNKNGIQSFSDFLGSQKSFISRQYALQTALQKKKMQQAMTYYQLAEELESKAIAMNDGIKSRNNGTAFRLSNQGVFGDIGSDLGGDLFGDLFSSEGISMPTFSSGTMTVNGKNYVMDATGNVYDANGTLITKDLSFGAKEQALEAFLKDNPDLKTGLGNAFNDFMANPFGAIGMIFKGGPKTPQDYLDEIMKQRFNTMKQNEANAIQNEIYSNIMKNALSGKNENYGDVANSFETNPIGNLSGISAGLRLTTGERMLLNKASVDLLTKAQELREKGDKLMLEALDRTETQKRLDGIWSAQLFRNTLANIKI
ncbi:MAG: hypothetical protein ACOVKP_03290 [Flavobacterium sp.]